MAKDLYKPIPYQQNRMENTVDQAGVGIASAFGPWWGALAQAGVDGSKKVRGDGMNENRNYAAIQLDPFKHLKAIGGGFKDSSKFLETIPIVGTLLGGKRMRKEAEAAAEAQRRELAKINVGKSTAFYNSEMRRLGGDFSLSSIPQP